MLYTNIPTEQIDKTDYPENHGNTQTCKKPKCSQFISSRKNTYKNQQCNQINDKSAT